MNLGTILFGYCIILYFNFKRFNNQTFKTVRSCVLGLLNVLNPLAPVILFVMTAIQKAKQSYVSDTTLRNKIRDWKFMRDQKKIAKKTEGLLSVARKKGDGECEYSWVTEVFKKAEKTWNEFMSKEKAKKVQDKIK